MNLVPVISIVASAGVAIFVMFSSHRFARVQARRALGESIMPCLAFIRESDMSITMMNVGKGPAINILLQRSLQSIMGGDHIETRPGEFEPVAPLPVGGRYTIYELAGNSKATNLFAAQYSNMFNDRLYQTVFEGLKSENTFTDLGAKHTP
jgi:hypothetical protein